MMEAELRQEPYCQF